MSRYVNYILLGIATFSAIILRTVMSFFIIDTNSGFVRSENLGFAIFIIIVSLFAAAVVSFFSANNTTIKIKETNNKGLFFKTASVLLGVITILSAFVPNNLTVFQKSIETLLSLGFGAYLIATVFTKPQKDKLFDMWLIVSVVYWLVKLVNVFTVYSALSNTFDNIFEVFTISSVLFFFLFLSKSTCLEEEKKTTKGLNITAYLSCFMALSCSVPKAIIVLTNNQTILGENKSFLILLLTGIYILSFIIDNTKRP